MFKPPTIKKHGLYHPFHNYAQATINGKLYDTTRAYHVADMKVDELRVEEHLYQSSLKEFFILRINGHYKQFRGLWEIIPITLDQAKDWVKRHKGLNQFDYAIIFSGFDLTSKERFKLYDTTGPVRYGDYDGTLRYYSKNSAKKAA